MSDSFDIQNPAFGISPTRRLAVTNLALRDIETDSGLGHADAFRRDLYPDLRADYVLANPPFKDRHAAERDSAFLRSEAGMQVVSEARDSVRTSAGSP